MSELSNIPISRNKVVIPPRRRELITRPRLIDALYDQMEKRVLIVVAPAGYGKTSLLVDLARQTEMAVCWLSLDALDQEPQRFLGYLIATIAERFPKFGRDSLAALESMASVERDAERLIVTITNEISARINEHFLIILDDYHLVGGNSFVGHTISRFVQLAGENVHLILSSRTLPDLPNSPLLVARNQIGGLTFEDLSFLAEEIQKLFKQNNGVALSRADTDTLLQQTEGWIAAIHLSNGSPGALPRLHPLESTRELFDFFSKEVLLRQTEQVRRFLLMTSIFDTFDVELCRTVLEPLVEGESFDWPVLFDIVRTNNIFSVPVDDSGRWMRYHHLFHHFLKSQLQYERPALAWHIQQNLAVAYEKQQSWEEALEIYARMDDYDNQVRVLKHSGAAFLSSGRLLSLSYWLEKIPEDVVYSQPVLISLLGAIYTSRGDNRRALDILNLAEGMLRSKEWNVDWVRTLSRRAEVHRQLGSFDQALKDVETILDMTQEFDLPDAQFTYAEAQRIKGLVYVGLGDMQNALIWLERSLHDFRRWGLQKSIPILETELGVVHRRLGNLDLTAQYYTSALKALENAGNTGWKANLLNNMGLLYHINGRLDQALSYLNDAVKVAEQSGYTRVQANVLVSMGDLYTDLSDYETAYEYYDRALTLATNLGHSLYIFYTSFGCARLQRLGGEPLLAVEELRQTELSQVNLGDFERGLFNLELGCCWLDMGEVEQALVVLRDAVDAFEKGGDQMEYSIARLWLESALVFKSPSDAARNIRNILPPPREWERPTPFMIQANHIERWLKKNKNSHLFADLILAKFFGQAELVCQSMTSLINRPGKNEEVTVETPQLDIVSFGDAQVRRNQRAVGSSDWQTREARDLFFFLVQSPPLSKEQIALQFWPDISPARLKMRFKIKIYRIRQAVSQDVIIYENERYGFNRAVNYTWDREKLDGILGTIHNMEGNEKLKLLTHAIGFLKRPYLADLDAEWAVADRLRYHEKYQELLVALAEMYLEMDRPQECLKTAKLVLDADPLLELAHRLMIQAYATLHDPVGMTLQYRKYQQVLLVELGIQPSSEMSALYEHLLDTI